MLRTRVTILAGFLGAGKTTLLNALLRHTPEPLGVIVNDFGSVNIDAALVAGHTALDGEVALQNGCICCTIRGDLLAALLRLRRRENPPSHIIIEASGVSDPAAVARTFVDPRLSDQVELAAIVGSTHPTSVSDLLGSDRGLASSQLRVCDIIVTTKYDVANDQELAATAEFVRIAAPRARVVASSLNAVPTALVLGTPNLWDEARLAGVPAEQEGAHVHEVGHAHGHHHHGHAFETWTFQEEKPLSIYGLRRALVALPTSVFRAKGFVQVAEDPNARLVVHVVGGRAELRPDGAWAGPPRTELVFLGRGGGLDANALRARFEGCIHDGRPAHEAHMEDMLGYFNRLLSTLPGHLG
jgi:G3E family GTPase